MDSDFQDFLNREEKRKIQMRADMKMASIIAQGAERRGQSFNKTFNEHMYSKGYEPEYSNGLGILSPEQLSRILRDIPNLEEPDTYLRSKGIWKDYKK